MPYPQTTSMENFLRDIDEVLVQYTSLLCSKGYSNTRVLAHLTLPDISELPIGHRRLLINEVNKIQSPHSKALLIPSFNTNLNHTSLYTVPSMQFGSPPISAFGNTPLHCPAPL